MYSIIGGDQKEYGPVSVEELRSWITQKRANGKTLVKRAGSEDWKPLSTFPELAAMLTSRASDPSADEPVDTEALREELLSRPVRVDIGSCLGRAWETLRENPLVVVGGWFLVFIANVVLSNVPLIGWILSLVFNGVLMGGLYWCYVRLIRGQSPDITEVFSGFSRSLSDLILANVVMTFLIMIPILVLAVPFFIPFFIALVSAGANTAGGGNTVEAAVMGSLALIIVGIIMAVLVGVMLSLIWIFTFPLIADRRFGFWDAMEISRKTVMRAYFPLLAMMLLAAGLGILGVLACCIGAAVTTPLIILMFTYAYEDILGERTAKAE